MKVTLKIPYIHTKTKIYNKKIKTLILYIVGNHYCQLLGSIYCLYCPLIFDKGPIWFHSLYFGHSFQTFLILGLNWPHRCILNPHKFSMELRSANWAGQFITSLSLCSSNHYYTILAIWIGDHCLAHILLLPLLPVDISDTWTNWQAMNISNETVYNSPRPSALIHLRKPMDTRPLYFTGNKRHNMFYLDDINVPQLFVMCKMFSCW